MLPPDCKMPKVSVVITAYNSESYIKSSVQAALNQDYPDFEVLVLNDGSTDKTEEICLSIRDPRFRYIGSERLGRCRALNEAVSQAKGEYIAINDADDLSLPHRLKVTINFIQQHEGIAFVATRFFETETFHERIPAQFHSNIPDQENKNIVWPERVTVFRRNLFNNSTLVYPKSLWKAVDGYDERLSLNEDYDFYLRAMQFGKVALLPVPTVLWFTNPNGYFKQKSINEYLKVMAFIKKRAFRLLDLPIWMRFYHPLWVFVYKVTQFRPIAALVGKRN